MWLPDRRQQSYYILMSDRKFDNFDEYAKDYREVHTHNVKKFSRADSNYFSEYKILELKRYEKSDKESVILDLGCGDGNSEVYFNKHFISSFVYGIDISKSSIAYAKQKNLSRCSFLTYDGEYIPFDSCIFDIVFIAGVFHHVNKAYHKKIIKESYRVLKNGGRLYIFEHNPVNPLTKKIVNNCKFDRDAELILASSMMKNVFSCGFHKADVK